MSTIIPFTKCIARPTENGQSHYLTEHLEGVRSFARSFFPSNKTITEKTLMELAAISHDIGKAHYRWQKYIVGETAKGPNHSGCGAIFFSYIAHHYLQTNDAWDKDQLLWLYLTRDIADHHGNLKGYAQNNEIEKGSFENMDMKGIQTWLYDIMPSLNTRSLSLTKDGLDKWQYGTFDEITDDTIDWLYDKQREQEQTVDEMMDTLQEWRMLTAILISSDRFDIESISDKRFNPQEWFVVDNHIKKYCENGKDLPLAKVRSNAQESILDQWKEVKNHPFYILEMPTGYGKTVTALKLASDIAKESDLSKIIYVAPYLSILDQNANAIEEAMNQAPLQHHSMAILNEKVIDENERSDTQTELGIQAWASHIVCTSFVQWMKAIFPGRAQETLRRIFLHDSIVIIDEPQIVDAGVWNLFLKGLDSISRIYNNTFIFCSATIPPFTHGLKDEPKKLTVSSNRSFNRYQIKMISPIDAVGCGERLSENTEPSAAVIVNTIQDAIDVYSELQTNGQQYLLHGLMIPLQKSIQLSKIQKGLKDQRENRNTSNIRVVSTQIIEAGADLSFHYLYRALPILPSLTQAAGRVNRHGEKKTGIIETGIFLRNDRDTRFIYGVNLCRISDELLNQKEVWAEQEMEDLVKQYYYQMFDENSYESVLQDIELAIEGNWERISRHEVFDNNDYHRLPIFIPFDWKNEKKLLPENIKALLNEFNITKAEQIYDLFRDKGFRKQWTFNKNKRFQILFNQFILNVPTEKAIKLVSKEDFLNYKIPILEDEYSYDSERGLVFGDNEVSSAII